jgi:hypothetical protein
MPKNASEALFISEEKCEELIEHISCGKYLELNQDNSRDFIKERSKWKTTRRRTILKKKNQKIIVQDSFNFSSDESDADTIRAFERLRSKNLIPDPNDVASDDDEVIDQEMAMVQAEKKVLRNERTQRKLVREQSLMAVQTTGLKKLTHTVSVSAEDINTAPRTTGKNDFGDDVNASGRPSIFNKEAEVDSVSSDESAVDNDKAFERLRSKNLIPDPNDVASDDDEVIDRGVAMVQAEKKVLRKERTQRKLVREKNNYNLSMTF